MIKDVTLELDDFSRNRIISGPTAMAQQVYVLLNTVPGDSSDDPAKGIDMLQYRIGLVDENAPKLKKAIEDQVGLYCDFDASDVQVVYKNGELIIGITSPSFSEILVFTTNNENILSSIISS
jgi:hypothetical protein